MMNHQDGNSIPAPTVALLYKVSRKEQGGIHVDIALQDSTDDDGAVRSIEEPSTVKVEIDDDDRDDNNNEKIPESVLRYERQLRRAQHAKKVGAPLDPADLKVIYCDDHLVVVNKPPGVLCVPGLHNRPSLLDRVHSRYGGNHPPASMIVHRLDMDTSGVVLFSRGPEVTKKLHAQFRDRSTHKEYECLVMGHLLKLENQGDGSDDVPVTATIDLPLQRDHEHPPFVRISTPESERAAIQAVGDLQEHGWKKLVRKRPKPSQSGVQVVEHGYQHVEAGEKSSLPFTRLRLQPITGRTHQLRVHCAAVGFPIVGDPTYSLYGEAAPMGGLQEISINITDEGESLSVPSAFERCPLTLQKAWTSHHPPNEQPMCLHAALLRLEHPVTGETMEWISPPDF
jgi:tRNA pseudouridine32 synthase/23S rRNA pseudouridine746 synthase